MLFATTPITAALCKGRLRLFLVFWIIVLWVDAYFGFHKLGEVAAGPAALRNITRLKFLPIELRNGQREDIKLTGLSALGLVQRGALCPDLGLNFTDGPIATVQFPKPTDGHSLVMQTGDQDPALDVVRFEIWAEKSGGEWEQAAMSGWLWDWDARLILHEGTFAMPEERNKAVVLDTVMSLGWMLGFTGTSVVTGSGLLLVVGLASSKREHLASKVFLGMLGTDSLILILAVLFVESPVYVHYLLLQGLCLAGLTVGLVCRQDLLLQFIVVLGVFYLGWGTYESCYTRFPLSSPLSSSAPSHPSPYLPRPASPLPQPLCRGSLWHGPTGGRANVSPPMIRPRLPTRP